MTQAGMVTIDASDGFDTQAYYARPESPNGAGLICIMEIFGVNDHMRRVADGYAAQGYQVLVPALYDRMGRDMTFTYDGPGLAAGKEAKAANGFDTPMHDVAGCVNYLRDDGAGRIGIVGYCYGGTVCWLAACRNPDLAAASCYYGTQIIDYAAEHPLCPTIVHWGRSDPTTPEEGVEKVARANPDATMYWYDAGHGFNSDDRVGSYDADAAALALERSLAFFQENLVQGAG